VSLLDIRLKSTSCKLDDSRAKSLLRPVTIVLPCFRRATSIELDTRFLPIKLPPTGELPLPALAILSISGNIVDLGAFLDRCPHLRVLGVSFRGVETSRRRSPHSRQRQRSALPCPVSASNLITLMGGTESAALALLPF
jgi:hypothetical protein